VCARLEAIEKKETFHKIFKPVKSLSRSTTSILLRSLHRCSHFKINVFGAIVAGNVFECKLERSGLNKKTTLYDALFF
jgi:hypothetical protein